MGIQSRIAGLLAGATMLAAGGAHAGDAASLHIVGFSDDARYFAFVQYGQTDGLGAGYADLFVIDNADNTWADGSPVRVLMDEDTVYQMEADGTLDQATSIAFDQALQEGAGVLARYDISGDVPGLTLAERTLFDMTPADVLRFTTLPISPVRPNQPFLQVQLTQSPYEDKVDACIFDYDQPQQYSLSLMLDSGEIALSDSQTIPTSRGCPLGYRLHTVVVSPPGAGQTAMVVITAMTQPGFEGPDHRFLGDGAIIDDLWSF
ncbi:MAG: DUF2259 domain-containing protein [Pseudomonadota bacterium]